MIEDIMSSADERMNKTIDLLRRELASVRAGRANPAMLDKIMVECYGSPMPINQIATIAVPEPRLITIQPWDKGTVKDIEKAIQKSDLGINPSDDGQVIRLAIPQLNEERRKELVKTTRKKADDSRVAVRNIRRDAIEDLKKAEKEKLLTEDDCKKGQERAQKLTDRHMKDIDGILDKKEKEILEV
ncbi:MAG: ribosome recycling factor [Peptococcaceae bacterium]|nr:ribosome recycling factor [Peptococcaceae bacterium]